MTLSLAAATKHLAESCEVMAELIPKHTPPSIDPKPPEQYFDVLVSSIIGQQLSVKAADTIEARVRAGIRPFTPSCLAASSQDQLREYGLSNSKATYVIGLAEAFASGLIDPKVLASSSDVEITQTLIQLKGIGPWTIEMFLIFGMGHLDVWSPGDLGLKKAVWSLFGPESDPVTISDRWRPYRSVAALYLWEHSDANPSLVTTQ